MQLTHRAWGLNSSTPSSPQVLFCRKAEVEGKGQCHSWGTRSHLYIKANTPDPIDQRSQWCPQRPWAGCCRTGERQHSKYGSSPLWPPDPHLSSSSEESSGTLVNLALWITFYSATIQWKWSQRNSHSTRNPTFPDQALPFCLLLNPKRKIQSVTHKDAKHSYDVSKHWTFSSIKWKWSNQHRITNLKAFTLSPSKGSENRCSRPLPSVL